MLLTFLIVFSESAWPSGYEVDPVIDGALLGAGISAAVASEFLLQSSGSSQESLSKSSINAFDRSVMFSHSSGLDTASSIVMGTLVLSPAVFSLALPCDQAAAAAAVYAETFSYAYFAKNMLKYVFPRYRPYVYSEGRNGTPILTGADNDSFPSGHSTAAFTAAAFSVYTYSLYFPDSPYLVPFGLVNFGLAGLTSALRVASGVHFMTDVIAGSLLGAGFGLLVPYLHTRKGPAEKPDCVSLLVLPEAVFVDFKL